MAKIVIDARELRTSTGRYVERLMHYLGQLDKDSEYLVLLKPEDIAGWEKPNERWKAVETDIKEFSFAEQLKLKGHIKRLKPDLVHFAMPQQPVSYKGKVVTTIHDLTTARFSNPAKNPLVFKLKQLVYSWVIKKVAKTSQIVITASEFVKKDVAQYAKIPESKIRVTYEAADPISAKPEPLAQLAGKQFILYVGRPTPHKNLNRLVDAFVTLSHTHPGLLLVLAGKFDKNYELLKKYADSRAIKNIVFTDFVSEGQLRWLYENGQAYVFPSLSEGFGLPGLEAMVHGLPLVSSNTTCLPEIYQDGAIYFDPTNTTDMAAKINQVLNDPKLATDLKAKGTKVAASYSWQRTAEQTLAIYREALNSS